MTKNFSSFLQKIMQITCVISFLLTTTPEITHAQVSATVALTPENPAPNSTVELRLESYTFDVSTANITWKVNGAVVLKGAGERTLSLRTGDVGDTTLVTVLAESATGISIEQRITITPSSVILLYESPRSYVPLLYAGRSLPSDGALVRVSALPLMSDRGIMVSPSSLSYTWYVNGDVNKQASGLGKQSASIRLDFLKSNNDIKVIVRSPEGNVTEKTITVHSHAIMPILYEYDQVLGVNFTKPLERRYETIQDFSLSLQPFYVSSGETKAPSFDWFLDGLPTSPLGGRLLSLHPKENSYGSKLLRINIYGPDSRIQKAQIESELIFDTRK